MVFTTVKFLIFFITVFLIYYILPKKLQWIVLLFANIYFYLCACPSPFYMGYIIAATVITYVVSIFLGTLEEEKNRYYKKDKIAKIDRESDPYTKRINKKKKRFLILGIILTLSMLIVIKYTDFLIGTTFDFLNIFKLGLEFKSFDFIMPLGISFYTFMTLGYMIDVYRAEYAPEKNILKYFTFVSFFPHVLQGPIDKYNLLAEKLYEPKEFSYDKSIVSLYRIAVGIFKKIVVADKLAIVLATVTGNVDSYYGIQIIFTILIYAVQLYADFSGYMDIAIGVSGLLGIDIAENFNAPYFSKTMTEFWRRWHISLNQWFVNYIYIPLGGNRKGNLKKLRNVFIIFFISGLWHGAYLSYMVWGIYHGIIMVIANIIKPYIKKVSEKYKKVFESKIYALMQIIRTFILVCFGYFFLSVEKIDISFNMIKNMFMFSHKTETIRALTSFDCKISLLLGVMVLLILDGFSLFNRNIYEDLRKSPIYIRWPVYCLGIFIIVFFNSGTAQEFLYFQF